MSWTISKCPAWLEIVDDRGRVVCEISGTNELSFRRARLIASCPELMDTLQSINTKTLSLQEAQQMAQVAIANVKEKV